MTRTGEPLYPPPGPLARRQRYQVWPLGWVGRIMAPTRVQRSEVFSLNEPGGGTGEPPAGFRVGRLQSWRGWFSCLVVCLIGVCALRCHAETNATDTVPPAELHVSGFGLLGNRELRRSLRELQPDKQEPVFSADFIEDAFLILHSRLVDEGYLKPFLIGNLTLTNGQTVALWWDGEAAPEVPRDIQATGIRFEVIHGVLFHYDKLQIEGLTAMSEERAEGFFVTRDVLLNLKTARRFSPDDLQSSMNNLRRALANLGYRDALVRLKDRHLDEDTGRVGITLEVVEGPRYLVRALEVKVLDGGDQAGVKVPSVPEDQPFSYTWEQDAAQAVTLQLYHQGYPDARARIVELSRESKGNVVELNVMAEATRGERVRLGKVRFEGARHTRESFLHRRVRLEGPWLDRVEADRAREQLARLGSFRFVELRLEPEQGSPRDVVYAMTEGRRYELSLIAGYGSYDQLFGGFEFQHFNLWGVGHNTRLKLVQSFKSTHGIYSYGIPEFLLPGLQLFASADGFRREELTFDRQEVKLSLGVRRPFQRSGQQVGLRYSYEFLDAQTAAVGDEATRAAALIADWQMDRRDNPLLPRRGYLFFANVEFADPALGGESEYVRLELGASYHHPFTRGLIAHVGLLHGVVTSPDPDTLLPFNKRFFPGGENSVRGYQQGGASPVNASGDQLGAVSALQWNLELEQRITRAFSIVGFVDGVGITPVIESYPFDQVLWSVGGGVSWNTLIGPVRLEYGYNLDPRPTDPTGTLQFSVGFPF